MSKIDGKRILFIGPIFYGYHNRIIESLYTNGADKVDFFPERKYNFLYSLLNNLSKRWLELYQKRHYRSISRKIKSNSNYDYLFVIRGCQIPKGFAADFKSKNPKARALMYQWDSIESNNILHVRNEFDAFYSFDFRDCKKYNLKYVPLYYSIIPEKYVDTEKVRDLFFIGSFLENRYHFLQKLISYCEANDLSLKHHLYIPKRTFKKLLLKGKKLDSSILKFDTMAYEDVLNEIASSRGVIDISKADQSGLSQRVIETLSLNTKLITHNTSIIEDSEVYSPEKVAFIDEDNISIDKSFLHRDDSPISDTMKYLHIDRWINRFFEI